MDVNNVLKEMAFSVDKSEKYIKGLFTTEKKVLEEQFGDAISEDRINMLAFIKVGKKYKLTKSDIDEIINADADEDGNDIEDIPLDGNIIEENETESMLDDDVYDIGFPEEEDIVEKMKETVENGGIIGNSDWDRFMSTIPDPTTVITTDYERTPSIIVEIGPTYYLKLTYPKNPTPYSHEFDGKYGAYMKHAYKVTLVKVSDEDLYDVLYKEGEFKGKKAFVNGQNYTLWLDGKAAGYFGMFWAKHNDGIPDGRTFTFKKGHVSGKNVWTFRLPKK